MTVFDEQGYDGDDGDEGGTPRTNSDFAALRKANSATKKAEEARQTLARENAFLKAGINPEDSRLAYFYRGYAGELTTEKIRQAAIDAGFVQAPAPTEAETLRQQGAEAMARVSSYSQGAQATPDLTAQVKASLNEAYRTGGIEGLTAAMEALGIPQVTN